MGASPLDNLQECTVVVFAKEARRGKVKTRLAESLGFEVATRLYRCFLQDTATLVCEFDNSMGRGISKVLAYDGAAEHAGFAPFRESDFVFMQQSGENLGVRLAEATRSCFSAGARRLLIIGADSPTLSPRHLGEAMRRLERADVVVGPSFDGGYYLIGLSGPHRAVFEDISWSTPGVFAQTMRRCRAAGLLCDSLEFWYDVDTNEDLKLLKSHLFEYLRHRQPSLAPQTSALLATLDEQGGFGPRAKGDDA